MNITGLKLVVLNVVVQVNVVVKNVVLVLILVMINFFKKHVETKSDFGVLIKFVELIQTLELHLIAINKLTTLNFGNYMLV